MLSFRSPWGSPDRVQRGSKKECAGELREGIPKVMTRDSQSGTLGVGETPRLGGEGGKLRVCGSRLVLSLGV